MAIVTGSLNVVPEGPSTISNLINSSDEPPDKKETQIEEWLWEYWNGKKFEIYKVKIPVEYHYQTFSDISHYVYRRNESVMFAFEIVEEGKQSGHIFLNPGQFMPGEMTAKSDKSYDFYGYIIAEDKEFAECIFSRGGGSKKKDAVDLKG